MITSSSYPIEYFKKEAKQLFKQVETGSPGATLRVQKILKDSSNLTLMRIQHVVANEHGFSSWNNLTEAPALRLQLEVAMTNEPRLNDFGMGIYGGHRKKSLLEKNSIFQKDRQTLRDSLVQIEKTVSWLTKNITPIKTMNPMRTSYGMKHVVEKDTDYITNGVFIAAAIIAGYKYKTRYDHPNVQFGMSEKSFKTVIKLRRNN